VSSLVDILQTVGVAASLATGQAALFLSWQNNRTSSRTTQVTSTQLQVSVMPVPIIESSRLTWREQSLVILAVRVRNVGSGPILGLKVNRIRVDDALPPFRLLTTPEIDIVMPKDHVEYRMRLTEPLAIGHAEAQLLIEISYYDVLGIQYARPLSLLVTSGTAAGLVSGHNPVRIRSGISLRGADVR
jgi:hypothetical protein